MDGFKWSKLYYARAATAASPGQVTVGEIVAVAIRFLFEATIFWVVLLVTGVVDVTSWLMVPATALAGLAFGAPLMAYAATIEEEGYQFALVQRFIVNPMVLFAGTFYPLDLMPIYLQWVGWISPLWHGTQLARVLAYGMSLPWWLMVVHLLVLVGSTVVGVLLAMRVFTRRLVR
jgi:lipooligosaccharide transport system permease protein